jgi:hypothetical protein
MMAMGRMTRRLALAGVGATVLAVALPAPASAQQSDPPARTAKSDPGAARRQTPKPAKPVTRAAKPLPARREWTLQDALPDHSASMRQYDPPPSPGIGRMPLQSGPGTLGFETKTQVNPNQTPDGATIRGQDTAAALCGDVVVGAEQRQDDELPAAVAVAVMMAAR